jgi:curved DNA-binding protein CbpA
MDAFEVLGITRRLNLSEEELRAAFREAGKRVHPDAGGDEAAFAELQQAFATLLSPSKRLKHWLLLQGHSGDDRGTISPEVMDLFSPIGGIVQQADSLIRKRSGARSALGLALLENETQTCREAIEGGIGTLETAIASQVAGFPAIEAGKTPPDQAGQQARNLAFLEKWRASLQERFARLV